MLFTFSITAETTDTKTKPATKTLKLRAGYVTKISVLIPSGHHALAHLAIFHGETQIIPWGEDQWLEGDGETIPWEPDYELPSDPARLEARAWNEDPANPHTFYIRVWVDPSRVKPRWDLVEKGAEAMSRFVKRVMGE